MRISFRQLSVFLTLVELKSISATARARHVSQPTISMQMKELTETIGLPLYEQIGKQLYLTAAGEALAETARAMSDEWVRLQQKIDEMKGYKKGRLRIAITSTAKYFVPRLLGSFCKAYPDIELSLEVLNRNGVVQRLRENADDLYIMSRPPKDIALKQYAFLDNPLVLIAPLSHRLANKRSQSLKAVEHDAFILREHGSGTRLACDDHFKEHVFSPHIRMEVGSSETIKQAVASGLGVGIVSRLALASVPEKEGLTVLRIKNFPIHANWWVLYPEGKRLSPIATEFMAHLDTAVRDLRVPLGAM